MSNFPVPTKFGEATLKETKEDGSTTETTRTTIQEFQDKFLGQFVRRSTQTIITRKTAVGRTEIADITLSEDMFLFGRPPASNKDSPLSHLTQRAPVGFCDIGYEMVREVVTPYGRYKATWTRINRSF